MSNVTLEGVVYDGKPFKEGEDSPLFKMGCRQMERYDAMYDSRLSTRDPNGNEIRRGDTIVFDGPTFITVLSGDRTEKVTPPAKKAPAKKATAKKATKKAA